MQHETQSAPLVDPQKAQQSLETVQRTITEQAEGFWATMQNFGVRLTNPSSFYQMAILLSLLAASFVLYRFLRPRIREALGQISGWPKWSLRLLAILNRRLLLIIFTISTSLTYVIMLQLIKFDSKAYFVGIFASLGIAWLFIAVVSGMIKNRTLRKVVTWVGWIYVTLKIVGLWDRATTLLDSAAIEIGGTHLSVLMVLTAILTLAVLMAMASVLSKYLTSRIQQIDEMDMSPSIKVLLTKGMQLTLYSFAFLLGLRTIGFDLGNLALISGAIGLGIGFGLQKIVSNLVSGVIILLDKSIKPGDVISLEGTFGWITSLGARYASIETRDGREYLVPNEDFITNQVINWTHSSNFVRLDIDFGVSYDCDPHEVKKICTAAPLTVARVVSNPAPVCHIINFGDSSIDFRLRFWIKDPTGGLTNIRGNVYLALWDALKENNIEIPYPRRDVTILHTPQPPSKPVIETIPPDETPAT